MPTRRSEIEARCEGDLHHRGLTLPAAQMHHGATRKPMGGVYILDTHADTGVAHGGQKDLSVVIMGTEGMLTAPAGHLVELMEK